MQNINHKEIPEIRVIKQYIKIRVNTLPDLCNEVRARPQAKVHVEQTTNVTHCFYCSRKYHVMSDCQSFLRLRLEDRIKAAKELRICLKCMVFKWKECRCHLNKDIPYHKLLEFPKRKFEGAQQKPRYEPKAKARPYREDSRTFTASASPKEANINVVMDDQEKEKITLLPTAIIKVKTSNGKWISMRALVDQAATHSIITNRAADLLQLTTKKTSLQIKGVGNTPAASNVKMVVITAKPHFASSYKIKFDALIMKSITGLLPSTSVEAVNIEEWHNLADPQSAEPGAIDILISGGEYPKVFGDTRN